MRLAGIDFGSKLAGTTVVAYLVQNTVRFERSSKGENADRMLLDFFSAYQAKIIGVDAPLSLPGVYRKGSGYADYFYRQCDRELKAMSPMFLGGLTARAIKLKNQLTRSGAKVFETYPVQTARVLTLRTYGYRTRTPDFEALLKVIEKRGLTLAKDSRVNTAHDFDALLALDTVNRIAHGGTMASGIPEEGLIYY